MRKNVSQKIMAWLVCAVFMLAITGQVFAENAGKSDQIHEGNPSDQPRARARKFCENG